MKISGSNPEPHIPSKDRSRVSPRIGWWAQHCLPLLRWVERQQHVVPKNGEFGDKAPQRGRAKISNLDREVLA